MNPYKKHDEACKALGISIRKLEDMSREEVHGHLLEIIRMYRPQENKLPRELVMETLAGCNRMEASQILRVSPLTIKSWEEGKTIPRAAYASMFELLARHLELPVLKKWQNLSRDYERKIAKSAT